MSSQPSLQRVLIVDDHELTRFNLKLLLEHQETIEWVGIAQNGLEALEMVEVHHPNIIILDLQMPVMDGLTAAAQIKQIEPDAQIIAYSSVGDPQIEVMVQTAPIDAFCPKDAPPQRLVELIARLVKTSRE